MQIYTEAARGFSDISVLKYGIWMAKRKCHSSFGSVHVSLGFNTARCAPLSLAFLRSLKDGAATTINCAVNPELNTQEALYYDSCRPKQSSADSRSREMITTIEQ